MSHTVEAQRKTGRVAQELFRPTQMTPAIRAPDRLSFFAIYISFWSS